MRELRFLNPDRTRPQWSDEGLKLLRMCWPQEASHPTEPPDPSSPAAPFLSPAE